MSDSAARLLSLLSLLQLNRGWTGAQLADRLGVSGRTLRHDIERLRGLGYDVRGTRGGIGGYRLGRSGETLPPLLLDGDEAVAVAVGLRTGVNCIIGGMEETSLRALAKLEQVLPSRLRHRVHNLNRYTVPLPSTQPVPIVEPALLTLLVGLCHGHERLRFSYRDDASAEGLTARPAHDVEPYRLINRGHRWYLLGYAVDGVGWTVYEVDRMAPREPTGPRFQPRPLPADDVAEYVAARIADRPSPCHATVTLHASAEQLAEEVLPAEGKLTALNEHACTLRIGAESYRAIALILGRLGVAFTLRGPVELVEEVRVLADRYGAAV